MKVCRVRTFFIQKLLESEPGISSMPKTFPAKEVAPTQRQLSSIEGWWSRVGMNAIEEKEVFRSVLVETYTGSEEVAAVLDKSADHFEETGF
jgi:hypothetical protein